MTTPSTVTLDADQRKIDLITAILGLDPAVHLRCRGNPRECGEACTEVSCPLRTNRIQEAGDLAASLLDEFRWHRAWAEELEALGVVPEGTLNRVSLRVRKARLDSMLQEAVAARRAVEGVQVLEERLFARIQEIKETIAAIEHEMGTQGNEP